MPQATASQAAEKYEPQSQQQKANVTTAMETKQSFNQMKSPHDGQSQDDSKMATQGTLNQPRTEPTDTASEYRPLVLQQAAQSSNTAP